MPVLISFGFAVFVLLVVLLLALSNRRFNLEPFLCLSAGGLLSVTFLDFLPQGFSPDHLHRTGWVILSGLFIQGLFDLYGIRYLKFLDQFIIDKNSHPHHHHSHTLGPAGVCSIAGCLSVCSFFDGIRLFSGLLLEGPGNLVTGISLFFHLISEGVIVAMLGFNAGLKKGVLFVLTFFMTGTFILGALAAQAVLTYFHLENLMAFSTGILIYVCFVHLLPSALKTPNRKWFASGLTIFSLLHLLPGIF